MDHPCWGCYDDTTKQLTNYHEKQSPLTEDEQEFWDALSTPELSPTQILEQEVMCLLAEEIQREVDAKIMEQLRGRTVQKKSKPNGQ